MYALFSSSGGYPPSRNIYIRTRVNNRVNVRKVVRKQKFDRGSTWTRLSASLAVGSAERRLYSQLSLRRTPLGPTLSVRLREVSVL